MKTFATILVISLLGMAAPSAFAQTSAQVAGSELSAAAHVEDLRQRIPDFVFNQQSIDQLETVTIENWVTDWENATQIRYSYVGDQQSEALHLIWNDNAWVNDHRTTTSFEDGLPAVQERETWVNDSWEPESRSLLSYDGGTLSEVIEQEWVDGDWVNVLRTRMTISGGVIMSWENDAWSGSDWVVESRDLLEESGDDVHMILQAWDGGEWVNEERITYGDMTIPELMELLYELAEQVDAFIGFGFVLAFPDFLYEEWDGAEWVNVSRQTTEEDDQGRPRFFISQTWEDGEWVGESRLERTYDEDGNVESVEMQFFEDDTWMTFATESYTYGENGRLTQVLEQLHVGPETLNTSRITLEWTTTTTASEDDAVPVDFVLESVYPNPFNPVATVTYQLDASTRVAVRVYDALGRQVATLAEGVHAAGRYEVAFDASDRPSGLYIVRMETPSQRQSRTVSLIR